MNPEKNITPESKKPIELEELLAYENPLRWEFDGLIQSVDRINQISVSSIYSAEWQEYIEDTEAIEVAQFLQEKLKGTMLVDLGGGGDYSRAIKKVAIESHASTYIKVDKFFWSKEKPNESDLFVNRLENMKNNNPSFSIELKEGETDLFEIKADMLNFISRMPNNSAHFSINGIDSIIISSDRYHTALAGELARVTPVGGIVFGANAEVFNFLNSSNFKEKKFDYFEKREERLDEGDDMRPRIFERI